MSETKEIQNTKYSFDQIPGRFEDGEKEAIIQAIVAVEEAFGGYSEETEIREIAEGIIIKRTVNPKGSTVEIAYDVNGIHCGYKHKNDTSDGIVVVELIQRPSFFALIALLQRFQQ